MQLTDRARRDLHEVIPVIGVHRAAGPELLDVAEDGHLRVMTALFILRGVFHAATGVCALEFALSISHRHAKGDYFHGNLDLLLWDLNRLRNFNGLGNYDRFGCRDRLSVGSPNLQICVFRGSGAARDLHEDIPVPGSLVATTPPLLRIMEDWGTWVVNARLLHSRVERFLAASSFALVHPQIDKIDHTTQYIGTSRSRIIIFGIGMMFCGSDLKINCLPPGMENRENVFCRPSPPSAALKYERRINRELRYQ